MGKVKYRTINDFKEAYQAKYSSLDYDWSEAIWVDYKTNLCLICHEKDEDGNEHGRFYVSPNNLMAKRRGCPICHGGVKKTVEYYINKGRELHKDMYGNPLYDYSLINDVVNNREKIPIKCFRCGKTFYQDFSHHLLGCGCPYCAGRYKTTEDWIELCLKVQGDRYDYSKSKFVNNKTKVCIICPKHGEFWQYPHQHMIGHGCPACNESSLEKTLSVELDKLEIPYERWFRDKEMLGLLSVDFKIKDTNLLVECQGKQHVGEGGWGEDILSLVERDKRKNELCLANNYRLLYLFQSDYFYKKAINEFGFLYNEANSFYEVEKLLEAIIKD